ncbi:MAG: polysaccharide deacetylase family protein [Bacteroidales bacterium]|nr:polysaccharide deacetylase family protein [Bacteroidales bacterium]
MQADTTPMFEKVRKYIRIKTSRAVCDAIMLHRVRKVRSVIESNAVYEITPERLEEIIIKYKKRGYEFISADRLAELMTDKDDKGGRHVCLTFDDGYRDNFELAFPILKKHGCPFVVFVNIENLNRESIQWRYALENLLVANDHITLSDGMIYSCASISEKNKAFLEINKLYSNSDISIIKGLFISYDIDWVKQADELMMTAEMVREMSEDELCTIGSHAVRHCGIARLSEEEQKKELLCSRQILEEITGKEIHHFAYPFGNHSDTTTSIAKQIYKTAFIARGGKVRKNEDIHELTRFILN